MPDVQKVLQQMQQFVGDIHTGKWQGASGENITDIVNIGIGGSDLGPRMVSHALSAWHHPGCQVHFVANLDAADLAQILQRLSPERTLFIVASKTFTTQETMQNARTAREWLTRQLGEAAVTKHFVAVSTNHEEVTRFGINPNNVFEFWDWVGGRFSLWSAIGLPLACAIGFNTFSDLLNGARAMDEHFFESPPQKNLPGILALLQIWNSQFLGASTRAVLPYSQSLALLPRFLQQLEMESNGKRVDRFGQIQAHFCSPIIWGEPGTNGQHAFYQLIHQGGHLIPCEFIAFAEADYQLNGHQEKLLANCFAQSEALMRGKTMEEAEQELAHLPSDVARSLAPYKTFPGNQPSTTLLLPKLDAYTLGALIAAYEHKVFIEACIYNINPFDQWGVEYGKQLANRLLPMLEDRQTSTDQLDSSTAALVNWVKQQKHGGDLQ